MHNAVIDCIRKFSLMVSITVASPVLGQNLIANGDFEADTFTVWPGYVGGGNPEQIASWATNGDVGPGNVGINPVFEPQNPSEIFGWTKNEDSLGQLGINPVVDGRQPFADNGDSDGGLLFLQRDVAVYQDVSGLTVGQDYVLSVDYNARNCCGDLPAASLELNGELSLLFPNPDDFIDEVVEPVEQGAWWFADIPFTAEDETVRIEFASFPDTGGDATLLLDNISLTAVGSNDELIVNGDFEEQLDLWVSWPGYQGNENAGPRAPFRDNGNNETQVALLQNSAAIDQEISGLTVGETYTLSLDYNARDCCGGIPAPQLLIDGEPIDDFPNADGLVDPVGEDNDWYTFETTVVAEFDSVVLTIENQSDPDGSDSTLVVDNVFFGIPGGEFVTGDCDGDGALTAADLQCVSLADLEMTLSELEVLPGDLDGDGGVAFADFLILSTNFGSTDVGYAGGDIDLDGTVAFADFLVLSSNFGSASETASIPEPSSALPFALGLGTVLLIRPRRRRT